jgi:hypothetical protein
VSRMGCWCGAAETPVARGKATAAASLPPLLFGSHEGTLGHDHLSWMHSGSLK